jgi:competence protein ComEA
MMQTTPQERMALGVLAILVSAGVGARMLRRPAPAELTGPGVEADAGEPALRSEVQRRAKDAADRARPMAEGERIDPNTATEAELDRLPKVGPGQARKIVKWRTAHGGFRTVADLDSVPGIGAAALAAMAPYLTLPRGDAPERTAGAANRARAGDSAIPAAGASPVISVNSASAQELTRLPGIGPSLAGRIVAWRAAHGAFRTLDDLAQVPGIGPATVARIRAWGGATP